MATKNVAMVEDPWTPLKDLANIVEAAVLKNQPGILSDLEISLKKYKPTFIGLLKNPPRSSADASLVRKAATEGISLQFSTSGTSLSDDASNKQKLPAAVTKGSRRPSVKPSCNEGLAHSRTSSM